MDKAIPLALLASFCTATSSVCQRIGARSSGASTTRPDAGIIFRLVRRPIWLAGLAAMILGFVFQVTALRYGPLALVQPLLSLELLIVFGYMAILGRVRVRRRDWLAAAAMSAGLSLFLLAASPSGGREHAPGYMWWIAGLVTAGVAVFGLALAFSHSRLVSRSRRAAILGAVTGIAWGFVAAVIKEFSSHLGDGISAIFSTWSLYVLIIAGAASLLLASNALAAGPLAASQPGFTILDPLSATLLGMFVFGENLQAQPLSLAGEALALALLAGGAVAISHSRLVAGDDPDQATESERPRVAGGPSAASCGQI